MGHQDAPAERGLKGGPHWPTDPVWGLQPLVNESLKGRAYLDPVRPAPRGPGPRPGPTATVPPWS